MLNVYNYVQAVVELYAYICFSIIIPFIIVTDKGTNMCVGPGGNGAILSVGERGVPGPPGGEENGQLASDSGGG